MIYLEFEDEPSTLPSSASTEPSRRVVPAGSQLARPPLAEAVRDALRLSERHALRHVEVFVEGDHVVLRGWVPSYYLKQCAQVAALTVSGVRTVHNALRVPPR